MDPTTITPGSFLVSGVTGTVTYNELTATFTPDADLDYNRPYTATITAAARTVAGAPLPADYSWSFTTQTAPSLVAFVTSVSGTGNLATWSDAGGKSGLEAADAICQARATAAGFSGTFRTWLSDSNNDAYCRIHNLAGKMQTNCGQPTLPMSAGPWVRTDGFPAAELSSSTAKVYVPFQYDEFRNLVPVDTSYFTASAENGALQGTSTCSDWTAAPGLPGTVTLGLANHTKTRWSAGAATTCDTTRRLLCVQTGPGSPLPKYTSVGKTVFRTAVAGGGNLSSWSEAAGKQGLVAGDAICQARAAGARLANAQRFRAWLSDDATHAIDRIASNGPWVRLDGIKVANGKADLTDGLLFGPVNVTDLKSYVDGGAWTGTSANGIRTANTCANWSDGTSSTNASTGHTTANRTGPFDGWSDSNGLCNQNLALYCLED
jgi:hypothetical protein